MTFKKGEVSNPKGRAKGVKDIAPKIRAAFIRATKSLNRRGKPLDKIIEEQLLENPLATLKVMASYNPRSMNVDIEQKTEISHIIQTVSERQKMRVIDAQKIVEAHDKLSNPGVTGQIEAKASKTTTIETMPACSKKEA